MCKSPLHELLCALPKCEHHMHLEGSLEPQLLFELAERNQIELPQDDQAFASVETLLDRYTRFTSLDDFLHYYFIGMSVLLHEQDFESLAYTYFEKAHSQNVKHAEVFFDPQAHTSRGVEYQTVLDGFSKAQGRAIKDFGMSIELIVCLLRHLPASDCHQAYLTALPDLKTGKIRGLGLSSTEKGYPPMLFWETYTHAQAEGIEHLTAHAGEEADVDYMASAIHDLKCVRADHGIKLPQDPELMAYFARNKIMVTVCPQSNVELRCVKSISELPIRKYLDHAVPFSINSDDPAYFKGAYIQENYCGVQEAFDLSVEDWAKVVTNSILYSWCNEERKDELLKDLSDVLGAFALPA